MIALTIIFSIILIIIIFLNCPVTAEISYFNKEFSLKVKYLFLTLYPIKEKPPKPEKKKKVKPQKTEKAPPKVKNPPAKAENIPPQEPSQEPPKIPPQSKKSNLQKEELLEKIAMVKNLLKSSKKAFHRLIKGIKISDIAVDFDVANEDAAEAAIGYGKVNMVVYNIISFLRTYFTVSIKWINISCKYNSSESKYDGSCTVKLRPATALLAGISMLAHFAVNTYKMKKQENAEKKVPQTAN
ncbi:MAG: hypothetical protein RR540_02005 [Oscillospiraceae bacterium]